MTTVIRREHGAAGPGQPPAPTVDGGREQLRWFTTLWAMAAVLHYTDVDPMDALPLLVVALPALLLPANPWALGALLAGTGFAAVEALPSPANHKVVGLLVTISFAAAALAVTLTRHRPRRRRRRAPALSPAADPAADPLGGAAAGPAAGPAAEAAWPVRWLATAWRPIGLTLLVVYLFTVFHKLNSSFFDPVNSCAGDLLRQAFGMNGLGRPELPPGAVLAAAVGTVLVEAAILLLLAVPRLRCWGLLLGVGFHAVLAPASFWDFATVVYALYVLLIPTRVFARLAPRFGAARRVALAAFAAHLAISLGISSSGADTTPFDLPWHTVQLVTWYAVVAPLMIPLLRACLAERPRRHRPDTAWPGWRCRPAALLVVPLLAFLVGATPYLGLKTVANFSMFSNLRTEQDSTNHLLSGVSVLQIADYQRDTVTVASVELSGSSGARKPRWLRELPYVVLPWQELRRTVALWRVDGVAGARLEYLRGGEWISVTDAVSDPVLAAPMPWWERHLLSFRAINSGAGAGHCRW